MPVYSTVRGPISHMRSSSGTSVATPLVAAAAALLESLDPLTYGPEDLKLALFNAVDYVPGLDAFSGSDGRLNAARPLPSRPPATWASAVPAAPGRRATPTTTASTSPGDKCPDVVGPANGCPDGDRDGIRDLDDNCRTLANADQTDVDADTVGDACDPTPRGEDVDGDAKAALDDRCPTAARADRGRLPDDRQSARTADAAVAGHPRRSRRARRRPARHGSSRSRSPCGARAGIRAGRRRRSPCASRAPLASR